MAASKQDIERWLKEGKAGGATHCIVVCDTFDWDDYPVYITAEQSVRETLKKYIGENMQKVMEVYNLSLDFEQQLSEARSWNL